MAEITDLIGQELQHAGEPAPITYELMKLDGDRITSETDIPEEVFLYQLSGTPCFPRGDLTTVTGPAKSGKTFLISMLMACAVKQQVLAWQRIGEKPLKVLWYDTEQSVNSTKRILVDRVGKLLEDSGLQTFPDEQFYVFNVRRRTPEERMEYLEQAIRAYRPDLCIIDGIADLMRDINSGPESVELIQRLQALATTCDCNITTVIHLNRSGEKLNLRGWIGTVMVQKSFEVFNCEKVFNSRALAISMTFSRRYAMDEEFCYEIDDKGLPAASDARRQKRDEQGRFSSGGTKDKTSFNKEYILDDAPDPKMPWDYRKLFTAAFGTAAFLGYDDLERRICELGNIRQKQYYYKLFAEAERQRIVRKESTRLGRVGVMLLSPD